MTIVRLRILGECAVQVRERCIAPDAPQLFALLLYLCHVDGRAVHKTELFELLFPEVTDSQRASHNLRQLLYRLRGIGAPVETEGERIRLAVDAVASSLDDFASLPRQERLRVPASRLAILPSYESGLSPQLADWIETVRARAAARVKGIVRDDFRDCQHECDWESVVASGRTLRALGASSEEVVSGVAEALLMLGRKHEALDELDAFLKECEPSGVPALRQLRSRITRAKEHPRALESAFHGRHEVMQALARQWEEATSVQVPQLAVIVGPAGIGKTRLARELSSFALLHDGQCLTYRCDGSDAARPHALFRSLLPQLRAMRGSLGASPALQRHLDRVSSDATLAGPLEPAASEALRAEIQLALIDLVEAVASEKPLLLVVDDAHLLDAASRGVLQALVDRRTKMSVMLVCSYRATEGEYLRPTDRARLQVHQLLPLSETESLTVLRELLPSRRSDDSFLQTCIARAGGNPYYLHAIAHDARAENGTAPTPFDIRQFASSAYFSLHFEARTLYETCLLLGRFASLRRVRDIAGIDGPPLISALRVLEHNGLLCFTGGELRCAHALLEEASLPLIPTSVAALLHERIAQSLERECAAHEYPAALTWAAAESWIAADDVEAAARLLTYCASQAAALGESRSAAQALLHIPLDRLSLPDRSRVLNQIVEYSEGAGDPEQVLVSLRALYEASRELGCPANVLREIALRALEADLRHGGDPADAIVPLNELLRDRSAPTPLRLRAGIRLMIAADMNLDEQLAASTYELLKLDLDQIEPLDALRQQAELIYHTVFGDQNQAIALIERVLRQHPSPEITQSGMSTRRYASYALTRMGRCDLARPILLADYRFMLERHVTSEALYTMVLLAEACFYEGDFDSARSWLQEAAMVMKEEPHTRSLQGGYYSAAADVAILDGRLEDAEEWINKAHARHPGIRAPRFVAVEISLRLRIHFARGASDFDEGMVARLYELYERGCHLGAQDTNVEALWLAERARGRPEAASALLHNYLVLRRRERNAPEWTLRTTTASDPAWAMLAPDSWTSNT